jgi:predicted nucleotide-binding protein
MPKANQVPTERPRLRCSREEAKASIQKQIDRGNAILAQASAVRDHAGLEEAQSQHYTWDEFNRRLLKQICTTEDLFREYVGVFVGIARRRTLPEQVAELVDDIRDDVRSLDSIRDQVDLLDEQPRPGRREGSPAAASTRVFIIHGSDREAALDLQKMLGRECREVEAVMFEDCVDRALTIIENLDAMIGDAAFGLAIFTPDDFVEKADGDTYSQMRPNVVLELGWFYGHLGRRGAAIIRRKGTKVPSDLEGIYRIEYTERITEILAEVRQALRAAGLIT